MLMMMSFLEGDKWKRCEYIREGGEVMYVNSILKIEKVSESGYYKLQFNIFSPSKGRER